MKKILLPIILVCLFLAIYISKVDAFAKDRERAFTEKRDVASFNSIRVGSIFNVYVSQDASNKLEIRSTHNTIKDIITEVVNGQLIIKFKDNNVGKFLKKGNLDYNQEVDIYVSSDKLSSIYASGSCDIYSSGLLKVKDIIINASGASDIKLDLEGNAKCTVSGSSDVTLLGNADYLDINASGASDVNCKKLFVKNAKVTSSGSSDVGVNVSGSLSVYASGASDVFYIGKPTTLTTKLSGSADISSGK